MDATPKPRPPPPTARAHHHVPAFYLAGFTLSGNRADRLWVWDRKRDKYWRGKPDDIAHQRDFYRVDVAGVEPDAVEKAFARLENQAAPVLRKIAQDRVLPEGEDFNTLLNFVALQITRVPQFRDFIEEKLSYLSKHSAKIALSYPAYFEQFVAKMKLQGKNVPDSITRDSLLEFLEDESRYTVEIPRAASIEKMLEGADALLPTLARRSWTLLVATGENDDFICSDQPVILVPTKPNPPPFLGFGTADVVAMPLNRQMALWGLYEGDGGVVEAPSVNVGLFNQLMLDLSEGCIYSARENFLCLR
jgi:hypothetical protein